MAELTAEQNTLSEILSSTNYCEESIGGIAEDEGSNASWIAGGRDLREKV